VRRAQLDGIKYEVRLPYPGVWSLPTAKDVSNTKQGFERYTLAENSIILNVHFRCFSHLAYC